MQKDIRSCAAQGALLLFLLAGTAAWGQVENARLTFFGGGSFLKGEKSFTVDGAPKRSNFASGGRIGGRFTVDLGEHWAVEGAYAYGTNNLRIQDVGARTITRSFGTRVHQLTGNASYYFSESSSTIRPFVTAGVGLMRFNPTGKAKNQAAVEFIDAPASIQSNTKFEFNFGAGLEAAASDRFGLRLDLRDHLAGIPRFGIPQAPSAGVADFYPVSGAVNDVEASAGIVIYFGR